MLSGEGCRIVRGECGELVGIEWVMERARRMVRSGLKTF